DVVGQLKAYEERVKEEDKANDPQENLLYARTEYSNGNNDSSEGRGRGSYSRGRGRGRGQGRGQDNSQNQGQHDFSKNREENEQKVNLNEAQEKGVYHEEGMFFMMNHIQETIFMNEEKYTSPNSESNTDEDVYGTLKTVQVITRQGGLLIKVPRSANRLYKAQLNVGKEDMSRSDDMPIRIARLETIRLLIALTARKGWKIHHLDVKTDFLNGDRKELDSNLKEMGFQRRVHEKAVYRKVSNGEFIIIAVYGDDIFVIGTSLDLINEFKRRMVSQFEMSNLGELTYYLGCCAPGVYVLGDSLVDVRNNNYLPLSVAKADFPHNGVDYANRKSMGRFSNGENAVDFLGTYVLLTC
nr:GDSL esterase/lipase At5g55050-like [Tanacetum cinerariifolium]